MAKVPVTVAPEAVVDVYAALVRMGFEEGETPEVAVVTWSADEPIPFGDIVEAGEVLDLTMQFIAAIEANPDAVPDGWDEDDLEFAYQALIDGMTAVRDAMPALAQLDDANQTVSDMLEAFQLDGLFVPRLNLPVVEVE